MNFKEAKKWSKLKENRDWRDKWKYGDVIQGVGLGEGVTFDWGENATDEQKLLIRAVITSPNKWGLKIEKILDNPPNDEEQAILKVIEKYKLI